MGTIPGTFKRTRSAFSPRSCQVIQSRVVYSQFPPDGPETGNRTLFTTSSGDQRITQSRRDLPGKPSAFLRGRSFLIYDEISGRGELSSKDQVYCEESDDPVGTGMQIISRI
jgi:hypothetical protein